MVDVLAALGWIVAALFVGLWHGERGKRRVTENWSVRGHPEPTPRAEVRTPTFEADTAEKTEPSPEHVGLERLAERIQGEGGVSPKKAKEHARELMGSGI